MAGKDAEEYMCSWKIQVSANSPEDAAWFAESVVMNPESFEGRTWEVVREGSTEVVTVDLASTPSPTPESWPRVEDPAEITSFAVPYENDR